MISLAWNYLFLCRYNINSKQQVKGKFCQSHFFLPFAVCCRLDSKFLYCVRINFIHSVIDSFIHSLSFIIFSFYRSKHFKNRYMQMLFSKVHTVMKTPLISAEVLWMSLNTINSFIKEIPQVVLELPTSLKNWKLNLIIVNSPLKVLEELCQRLSSSKVCITKYHTSDWWWWYYQI